MMVRLRGRAERVGVRNFPQRMDPNAYPLGEHGFCVHDDTVESIRQPRTHNHDRTRSKAEPDNGGQTELPPSFLSPPPSLSLPPPPALSPSSASTGVPSATISYAESCSSNDRTDNFEQGNGGVPDFQDAKVVLCQSTVTRVRQGGDLAFGISSSSVDRNRQGVAMVRSRSTSEDVRLQTGQSSPSSPLSHNTEVEGLCNNVPLLQRSDMIDADGDRGSSCVEDEPKTTERTSKSSALKEGTTLHPPASTQGRTSFIIKGPPPPDVVARLYDSRRKSCPSAANLETISEDNRRGSQRGCRKEQAWATLARKNSYPSSFVSHQGHDVPESLVWAEEWLKSNDPEPRRNCRATSSVAGRTKAADSHFSRCYPEGPWNKEPAPEERLHNKATVDNRSIENRADGQQVEEMTGKPEITRLGRSKQRSVDDLFLYQQTAEETRRRKKSQRNAEEDNLLTGRPETCTRSTILVEQRRKESRNNKQLPVSERLHKEACERRRRQEERLANLEIAARLRAHPKLTATPKALSQNRGHNVGQRLYNQAFHGQLEARKRERLAYLSPQGATFHPEINPRSVSLARRRRRIAWKEGHQGGEDGAEAEGQVLVEEALLAVGAVYNHRRRQRQQRQEEIDGVLRRSARLNHRSEYLLRRVKQRAAAGGNDEADIGRQGQSRVPDLSVEDVVEDRATFSPKLEALGVSNKILKSRYGQGTVPTMAERANEWETRRIERMNRSVEHQQPYDAPRIDAIRQQNLERDGVNRNNHRSTGIDSSGRDIYERTTEYTRQRDQRRKAEREARLEEELANCTFAPSLISKQRSRGKPARTSPPSTRSSSQLNRITMAVSNNDISTPSCSLSRASTRETQREDPRGQGASTVAEDDALGERLEGAIMHQALPQGWSGYTTREGRIYYLSEEKGLLQWERPTE